MKKIIPKLFLIVVLAFVSTAFSDFYNMNCGTGSIGSSTLAVIESNSSILQSLKDADLPAKRKIINFFGAPYGGFSVPSALEKLQLKLGAHHKSSGSTVNYNGASIEFASNIGGRAFVNWDSISKLVEGKRYAISFDISNLVGTVENTVLAGANNVTVTKNGRYGIVFTKATQTLLRIGIGTTYSTGAVEDASFTLSNVMIQDITGFGDKFDSYVNRQATSEYNAGNTFVAGEVVTAQGTLISTDFKGYNQAVSTGDSFSNDINDFPQAFNQVSDYVANNYGYSGGRILGPIKDNWQAWLDHPTNADADFIILQGGVNDISANVSLDNMKAAWIAMANMATTKGITKALVLNISPWADHGLDQIKKQKVIDWNKWLAEQAEQRGYLLIDIFTLLKDKSGLFRLAPEYILGAYTGDYSYTGDAIHPNKLATFSIANLMKTAIGKELCPNLVYE